MINKIYQCLVFVHSMSSQQRTLTSVFLRLIAILDWPMNKGRTFMGITSTQKFHHIASLMMEKDSNIGGAYDLYDGYGSVQQEICARVAQQGFVKSSTKDCIMCTTAARFPLISLKWESKVNSRSDLHLQRSRGMIKQLEVYDRPENQKNKHKPKNRELNITLSDDRLSNIFSSYGCVITTN